MTSTVGHRRRTTNTNTRNTSPIIRQISRFGRHVTLLRPLTHLTRGASRTIVQHRRVLNTLRQRTFTTFTQHYQPITTSRALLNRRARGHLTVNLHLVGPHIARTTRLRHNHRIHHQGHHIQRNSHRTRPQHQTKFIRQTTTEIFTRRHSTHLRAHNRQLPLQPILQRYMGVGHNIRITVRVRNGINITDIARRRTIRHLRL